VPHALIFTESNKIKAQMVLELKFTHAHHCKLLFCSFRFSFMLLLWRPSHLGMKVII